MRIAGYECLHLPMHGMYDPFSAWKLRRFAWKWRANLLHGHAQRGARYALWASSRRCPALCSAHSTNAWKWFRHNHQIISVSAAVRDSLIDQGFDRERIHLVYPGVRDLGLAAPRSIDPLSAARPLTLGMLARLEKVKGHDIALEAVRLLKNRISLRLIFVGADTTDWARQMKERTITLGLEDCVEFHGETSDIKHVLDQMDLMLAPSRREALSLSLIETAAAGRASIGARVGGIPEVIKHNQTGLLVAGEDPADLSSAIAQLAEDGALRLRMGQAARRHYEQYFTQDAMARDTEACYKRTLAQNDREQA